MLRPLLRRLFPRFRTRSELRRDLEQLRSVCGADDGPPEMWNISLVIRDLEFERDRLAARVAEIEKSCKRDTREYHRVLKRWQHTNQNFRYIKPHELCELLLNKSELHRVLPVAQRVERLSPTSWRVVTSAGKEHVGPSLDGVLRSAYNHLGLGRKKNGTQTFRK